MASLGLDAPLRRELLELAEGARRQAGRLAEIAGTAATSPVPRKARAPARPKAAAATASAMTGEEMADELSGGLRFLFPAGETRVAYLAPTLWVDYFPLRLKLALRRQHALGGVESAADEVTAEQSAGPAGLFRRKQGTPREVLDAVARYFKRLKANPPAPAPAAPATGARAKRSRHGTRATLRLLALRRHGRAGRR